MWTERQGRIFSEYIQTANQIQNTTDETKPELIALYRRFYTLERTVDEFFHTYKEWYYQET